MEGRGPLLAGGGVRGALCDEEHPAPDHRLCIVQGLLWRGR